MDTRRHWKTNLLIFSILLLIGMAVYWNTLDNPFYYDDSGYVLGNLYIRDIGNIPQFFINPRMGVYVSVWAAHYRPMVVTSYAVNYAFGGLDPVGYHAVNLIFHVGTAFLLFLIVKALLDNTFAALVAGIIFLVHPFNSESVNYISARSSVISGFFYLIAFYFWIRFRKVKEGATSFYIASLIAFVLGMLSKEVVVTLPMILWLYDIYFRQTVQVDTTVSKGASALNWRTYISYIPFILVVVIPYLAMRVFSFGSVFPGFKRGFITQFFTELPVLVNHWALFFWPDGLSMIHDVEIYSEMTWPVLIAGILLILYTGIALYLLKLNNLKLRLVSFFMSWFFIVLLPTTLFPLNAIFQENRGYLAFISFAAITGIALGELCLRRLRILSVGLIIVISIIYSIITIQRNTVWGDELLLWKDVVEKAPRSPISYSGLASAYRDKGDLHLSISTAEKGLTIAPDSFNLHVNLGITYKLMGKEEQSIKAYKRALLKNLKLVPLWDELVSLYIQKGDLEQAELYLREAMKIQDDFPPLYYRMGIILSKRGRLSEAAEEFKKAFYLNPSYLYPRYELGVILDRLGRSNEAIEQYKEVIRLASRVADPPVLIYDVDEKKVTVIKEDAMKRIRGKGPGTGEGK